MNTGSLETKTFICKLFNRTQQILVLLLWKDPTCVPKIQLDMHYSDNKNIIIIIIIIQLLDIC